jgi:hypothetical protein
MVMGTRNDYQTLIQQVNSSPRYQLCNCIGPQNGQPACPCAMRDVKIVDGRYVRVTDLGPVNSDYDQHATFSVQFGGVR